MAKYLVWNANVQRPKASFETIEDARICAIESAEIYPGDCFQVYKLIGKTEIKATFVQYEKEE